MTPSGTTGGTTARNGHAWDRTIRYWDAYSAVAWAATLAFVLDAAHPGPPVRIAPGDGTTVAVRLPVPAVVRRETE
ncbi:hypothetical protein [Streptomyces sp. MMG1121]|uniref:hypothetical protein n=1 Tax=Streptomyces sp. MMG1121 TaxID=1415544 RepID=UPI0006ADAFF5|nr:hypothetical protein [Streptomyces sp. MMG1121]KOV62633.1 hypothetical protein ADK64_23660 [Streptomyces sp. MMG1121]